MGTSKTWQWIKSRFEWAHIWDTAFYVTGAAVMIYFFYWQTIEATFMDILHASSFVNILSFRAMWPYLKSGASMLSYINYGGTMASTVGRVGKVGVQILYRNTVQNSVVTTWRRIDPKREGSHREIGGDANVIAKWAYLLDASGNEAKATSVLADTFRRVNSVWRPLGDRRRPEIESEIEKHANIKVIN